MSIRSAIAICTCLSGSFALAQTEVELSGRLLEILKLRGDEAYESARQFASEHPTFEPAQRAVSSLYLTAGDIEAGRRYFEGWVEREPQNPYAHYGLGRIAFQQGALDEAIDEWEQTIALKPSFSAPFGLSGGLVSVYETKGNLDAAASYFESLARTTPNSANALAGLGWSYARSFRFDEGIRAFSKAIDLDPDLPEALHGLVQSYSRTGRYQKSWESSHALADAARRRADFEMLAYAQMMKGTIAYFRGDYRTALRFLHESRTLAEAIGDRGRVASSVNNSAGVYSISGDHQKALEFSELSLELARATGSKQAELNALGNVGTAQKDLGRYTEALAPYDEALRLAREAGFQNQESMLLANMAEALALRGDEDEAVRTYTEALAIAEQSQNLAAEAFASVSLASLIRNRGDYDDAAILFRRVLSIGEQTGEARAIWEAQAGLGSTYEKQGKVDKAIEHYAAAVALYDEIREGLAIESFGHSFLEDKDEAYLSIVHLLASRGDLEEAFLYAEKFKAKGFLDILARGQPLFETHLPEDVRFELDEIQQALHATHAELSRERASESPARATTVGLEERITELELRKSTILDRVREEQPSFYQLAVSEPIDAASLQTRVLEPGQVLLEYLVGDERVSVFVVTRDELHYLELPITRQELRQRLAAMSQLFEASSGPDDSLFNAELADFSLPPAKALYDMLVAPLEAWLPEGSALVIVPDDVLFYLPFEALVVDSEEAGHRYDFGAATFLLERHTVSYSPSASLLDPELDRARQTDRGVLALGNPSLGEWAGEFGPLPNSETEVEAIRDAFSGYDNAVLTGEAASEAAFKREANRYSILHFATHFSSDDSQPMYSRLVLGLDPDTDDDGVLQTYEIFDASLNAELAVLSACNTGHGRLRKGEGLIGVSRAFSFAGVPSLVVSLWSVDDRATAEIMELFYRHLRTGADKAEALRQAKIDYVRTAPGEKKDPFYWAPFILSGDPKPLALPRSTPRRSVWPWALLVAVAVGFLALSRYKRDRAITD